MSAKVTREHRENAVALVYSREPQSDVTHWVQTGELNSRKAQNTQLEAIAQSLADAEARGLASRSEVAEAKLQALCDMHNTAMHLRKYGREPEWLGAAFAELRAKYEAEAAAKGDGNADG